MTGLSVSGLKAMRRRGAGPAYCRYGAAVRYMRGDVAAYMAAARVETADSTRAQSMLSYLDRSAAALDALEARQSEFRRRVADQGSPEMCTEGDA